MRYLSLFSGIEAASAAWHPMGWQCAAVSEIEPFPRAVLAHHYPTVPNLGDITKFKEWPDLGTVDLVVGGSPCQSFSVAGLRKGMDDPRGNLMLTYLAVINRVSPRWVVYENVPGLLSSNGGRDFGTLLGGLAELGYGFAYRILDAQFFGVPQRRRRVFVVGYLGDWRPAAAVLFERESLLGYPAPRREAGKRIAATLTRGAESSGKGGYAGRRQEDDVNIVVAPTLSARTKGGGGLGTDFECDGGLIPSVARALTTSNQRIDAETETLLVAHSLRGEGFDASEDGTGRDTPLVPVACLHADALVRTGTATTPSADAEGRVRLRDPGLGIISDGTTYNLMASGQPHAIAFAENSRAEVATALRASQGGGDKLHALTGSAVRRLTPRECERLQGFPDDYTLINVRGKPAADGPRYKALGNSMAVPVMRWIGERIQLIDNMNLE